MKTLIFNGSPRKNGDTASLINKTKEHLVGDIKTVDAYRCNIQPCIDCRYCRRNIGCVVKDDMQGVYEYLQECDNILIASPIYYSELTGQLLNVFSRLQMYYSAKQFQQLELLDKPKKGAVILVGGGNGSPDIAEKTALTLLRTMNSKIIHPIVISHNTDNQSAVDDKKAVDGAIAITEFFNDCRRY